MNGRRHRDPSMPGFIFGCILILLGLALSCSLYGCGETATGPHTAEEGEK